MINEDVGLFTVALLTLMKKERNKKTKGNKRALRDSNPRPTGSKPATLSS